MPPEKALARHYSAQLTPLRHHVERYEAGEPANYQQAPCRIPSEPTLSLWLFLVHLHVMKPGSE